MGKEGSLFNLTIDLKCSKTSFNGSNEEITLHIIRIYGMSIHVAMKLLKGNWHVRKDGYLEKGHLDDLEERKAVLEINDNIPNLLNFPKNKEQIHVHYEKDGVVERIGKDENGIFLVDIKV